MIRFASVPCHGFAHDRDGSARSRVDLIGLMSETGPDGKSSMTYWTGDRTGIAKPYRSLSALCDAYNIPIDYARDMIIGAIVNDADWMSK